MAELLHADEDDEQLMPGIQADLTLAAVRILAAAGAAMRGAAPDGFTAQAEELQGELLQLCRQGAPKAAKAAVRWGTARGRPTPRTSACMPGRFASFGCMLSRHSVQRPAPTLVPPAISHGIAWQHLQHVQL